MSAFVKDRDGNSCRDCYGSGIRNRAWDGKPLKEGPVVCGLCRGTGEKLTDLGYELADFLEVWEARKK